MASRNVDWNSVLEFLEPEPPKFCPHAPTPKQKAFLRTEALEVLYGGRAGGGKSDALLMGALQYVHVPNYAALLLRNTFADLALPGALMARAQEWFEDVEGVHSSGQKHQFEFPSGATITFGYMDKPNDHLKYKCLAPYTEVLTEDGWKKIEEILEGERVATLNPDTREMTFEAVTETHEYDFDGEMVETLPGADVAFSVTPNHTIWATTNRVRDSLRPFRADKLPTTARIPQWALWEGMYPSPLHFKGSVRKDGNLRGNAYDLVIDPKSWVEFLGWWTAEGCLDGNVIRISQTKKGDQPSVERVLDAIGARWSRSGSDYRFTNRALANFLRPWCGSRNKRVPRELLNYSSELLQLFLDAYVEGDGTWKTLNHSSGTAVTTSRGLADDVCEVAIRCGYRATVDHRTYDPKFSFNGVEGEYWLVHLHYRNGKDTIVGNKERGWRLVAYKGKVYCLTVPPHHTFLIRHQGRISWTGNSAEFQYIGFDEVTEIRENHYRYLFSRLRRPSGRAGLVLSKVPLRMRSASNPAPNWVRRRFIEEGKTHGRLYIPAGLIDNPFVDHVAYSQALGKLDEVERARLEAGDWYAEESGAKFSRDWFPIIGPEEAPETFEDVVRYWDLAATIPSDRNPDPDYTVGAKVGLLDGFLYVLDMRIGRLDSGDVEKLVLRTAQEDGPGVRIRMEQEPGASGKYTIDNYARYVLLGYDFDGHPAVRNKEQRADVWAPKAKRKEVKLIRGDWITQALDQLVAFGAVDAHDDVVDAISGAVEMLIGLGGAPQHRLEIIV